VNAEAAAVAHTALYEGLALLIVADPQTGEAMEWERAGAAAVRRRLDGLAAPAAE
jgi:hypothetical protein